MFSKPQCTLIGMLNSVLVMILVHRLLGFSGEALHKFCSMAISQDRIFQRNLKPLSTHTELLIDQFTAIVLLVQIQLTQKDYSSQVQPNTGFELITSRSWTVHFMSHCTKAYIPISLRIYCINMYWEYIKPS